MSFTEFWQAKKAAKAMKKRKTRSLTTEMRLAEPCRSKINKEIIFATRHDAIVVPIKLCRKLLARFDDFNDDKSCAGFLPSFKFIAMKISCDSSPTAPPH